MDTITFSDIFQSSFLENITSISILDIAISLVLAFGLGVFIFFIYKKTFSGVMYSSSFALTLIALTMITTVVILAVSSNVVLSLGMVGALSVSYTHLGGHSIGVYDPASANKQAVYQMIRENRIRYFVPADYTAKSPMDTLIKTIINKTAAYERLEEIYINNQKEAINSL